ncbi:conserved hypothetical protein [Desulfonatronospira thiodismutans ASO3-1]|uniref:DUF4007 domain-containing protein n=1 Tax=Desulfonatronospira thiodismutans ASO3-1 TaxID=555779 RepID=D6SJQ9_9BACT|nr:MULTISPECIES: hypothetical protein [Desulfonatronospira]EFI36112.1 conserved hypothetical protein [Desulfonatronospira thiodismutans ASO3-1]
MLNKQVMPGTITDPHKTVLARMGFRLHGGGVHTARTIMLQDLKALLSYIDNPEAGKPDYRQAVVNDNCLGKRSGKTRTITFNHLSSLYGLDPGIFIFRNMLHFWKRDNEGRALLAILCACCRDPLLRLSSTFILKTPPGNTLKREDLEEFIDSHRQDCFSRATLKSAAQNLASSWTKSGHLRGKYNKVRTSVQATPGSIAYALLLGHISGLRGQSLFACDFFNILDCSVEQGLELARESSRRGWMVFKNIGEVIEVQFPGLITPTETERLNEQNQTAY